MTMARPHRNACVFVSTDAPFELDGALDRRRGHGETPGLVRRAERQHVGLHVAAEQLLGQRVGVEPDVVVLARRAGERGRQLVVVGERRLGVRHLLSRRDVTGRHDSERAVRQRPHEVLRVGGDDEIEGEVAVGMADADRRHTVAALLIDAHVRDDRAALLAQPGLVERGDVVAVEQGGGGEDLADGDDTGATDAGHHHRERTVHHWPVRRLHELDTRVTTGRRALAVSLPRRRR